MVADFKDEYRADRQRQRLQSRSRRHDSLALHEPPHQYSPVSSRGYPGNTTLSIPLYGISPQDSPVSPRRHPTNTDPDKTPSYGSFVSPRQHAADNALSPRQHAADNALSPRQHATENALSPRQYATDNVPSVHRDSYRDSPVYSSSHPPDESASAWSPRRNVDASPRQSRLISEAPAPSRRDQPAAARKQLPAEPEPRPIRINVGYASNVS